MRILGIENPNLPHCVEWSVTEEGVTAWFEKLFASESAAKELAHEKNEIGRNVFLSEIGDYHAPRSKELIRGWVCYWWNDAEWAPLDERNGRGVGYASQYENSYVDYKPLSKK